MPERFQPLLGVESGFQDRLMNRFDGQDRTQIFLYFPYQTWYLDPRSYWIGAVAKPKAKSNVKRAKAKPGYQRVFRPLQARPSEFRVRSEG